MIFFLLSVTSILFICSFSSIFSALVLIFSSFITLMVMYWNLVTVVPLYIFSLFLLGGLYVLLGFVMMADMQDLKMALSSKKLKEIFLGFLGIYLGFTMIHSLKSDLNLYLIEFSSIKTFSSVIGSFFSISFIFMIFYLLIYLFIIHVMMKSSSSGGGFIN